MIDNSSKNDYRVDRCINRVCRIKRLAKKPLLKIMDEVMRGKEDSCSFKKISGDNGLPVL